MHQQLGGGGGKSGHLAPSVQNLQPGKDSVCCCCCDIGMRVRQTRIHDPERRNHLAVKNNNA